MRITAVSRHHRRGCTALASAVTLTAVAALLATGSPPAQAAPAPRPHATTPDKPAVRATILHGVSAVSATDAWAVGYYFTETSSGTHNRPVALHWNGSAWSQVTSPVPSGAQDTWLSGVSADSAADAWAAGYYENASGENVPLIEQWNGTAWTKVTSPVPSGTQGGSLNGVSAVSATDAWAVGGYHKSSGVGEPLILHSNGTKWKVMKSPAAPSGAQWTELTGVSAVSATDAWAAGWYENSSGVYEPLILHWNGTAWTKVKSPAAPSGAQYTYLEGVGAVSATDAWAVGYSFTSGGVANVPLLLHCNGTACKQLKTPVSSDAQLGGVGAVSANDAWAAGWYENSSGVYGSLILHWNGTKWKVVKSPAPKGTLGTTLYGVSAVSATDVWAAGYYYYSATVSKSLILHSNGKTWKKVKSPNGA